MLKYWDEESVFELHSGGFFGGTGGDEASSEEPGEWMEIAWMFLFVEAVFLISQLYGVVCFQEGFTDDDITLSTSTTCNYLQKDIMASQPTPPNVPRQK